MSLFTVSVRPVGDSLEGCVQALAGKGKPQVFNESGLQSVSAKSGVLIMVVKVVQAKSCALFFPRARNESGK